MDLPLRKDGKLDVGGAVGHEGTLTVIKDLQHEGALCGQRRQLLGGEIAEDVAGYFVESRTDPHRLRAGGAGGQGSEREGRRAAILSSCCPEPAEDTIAKVEGGIMAAGAGDRAFWRRTTTRRPLLRTGACRDFEVEILETSPVEYRCYCSRERVERALICLGAGRSWSRCSPGAGRLRADLPVLRRGVMTFTAEDIAEAC